MSTKWQQWRGRLTKLTVFVQFTSKAALWSGTWLKTCQWTSSLNLKTTPTPSTKTVIRASDLANPNPSTPPTLKYSMWCGHRQIPHGSVFRLTKSFRYWGHDQSKKKTRPGLDKTRKIDRTRTYVRRYSNYNYDVVNDAFVLLYQARMIWLIFTLI